MAEAMDVPSHAANAPAGSFVAVHSAYIYQEQQHAPSSPIDLKVERGSGRNVEVWPGVRVRMRSRGTTQYTQRILCVHVTTVC